MDETYFICDIDGVLADCSHRIGCLKNYEKFYSDEEITKDKPIHNGIILFNILRKSTDKTIILTGRNAMCKEATERWLKQYGVKYDEIIFRRTNDWRPAAEVKREEVERILQLKDSGAKIFYIDDSYQNVRNICNISSNIAGMTFKVINKKEGDSCQAWII